MSSINAPYDLSLVCNRTTAKYGFTEEKVALLEAELLNGKVQNFAVELLKLPLTVTSYLPTIGPIVFPLEDSIYTLGIYQYFPTEMRKWVLYHVEKNLGSLNDEQCSKLHESFCSSEFFPGDVPHYLAFSLASPIFRATYPTNSSVSDLEPDPKVVASFINKRVVPHYETFTEVAKLIKIFNHWKLGDIKICSFNQDAALDRCITADPNRTWVEMHAAFEDDPDYLSNLKKRFCERFISLCSYTEWYSPQGLRVLPFSVLPLICNGGPFYNHLLDSSNAISILDYQVAYEYQSRLLNVTHPTLLGKFHTVVAECKSFNLFVRYIDCKPCVTHVYLYPESTVYLHNYSNLLNRGVQITFAKTRFTGRFALKVEDSALFKNVTFECPNEVTIKVTKMTDPISIPGWITYSYTRDRQYYIEFKKSIIVVQ